MGGKTKIENLVLIGADEYHAPGAGKFVFGATISVPDEIAHDLLSKSGPTGQPYFKRQNDLATERVKLRLADQASSYRCALFSIFGKQEVTVSADLSKHLLSIKRNQNPVFTTVED